MQHILQEKYIYTHCQHFLSHVSFEGRISEMVLPSCGHCPVSTHVQNGVIQCMTLRQNYIAAAIFYTQDRLNFVGMLMIH